MARRRGVGSITSYSTKSGQRWRWQMRVPVDPENPSAGLRPHGKAGYLTAKAADDALQEARRAVKAHQRLTSAGAPTVADYAAQWLDSLSLERSTVESYRRLIRNHITPYLGAHRLDRVTSTMLARHYRMLEREGRKDAKGRGQGLSANSVAKVHVTIGALLDAAIDDGHVAVNVARKRRTVQAPTGRQVRKERAEVATWTAGELRSFLTWSRDVFDDDLFTLWHVYAHTGMRRSEALALRWSDVDLKAGRISVRRAADVTTRDTTKLTKTGGMRAVDIDAETVGVLRAWKALRGSVSLDFARPSAYVFGDKNGRLRWPDEVSARWAVRIRLAREALGEDELPHVTIKGLRHTHATLLLGLGIHPKVVQERLGHSDIATTMNIYSHVTPTMQRQAVEKLAAALGGGES